MNINYYNKKSPDPDKKPELGPKKPEPSHNQGDAYKGNDNKKINTKNNN